jgi:carbon monoxide dehydrogenase subunit G
MVRMQAERRIGRPRAAVWAALNDTDVLRASLPGCCRLERTAADTFSAEAVTRVGSVQCRFRGTLRISDVDPPHGYRLSGEGDAGPSGFAKGAAVVRLFEDGDGTRLAYSVDAVVGGRLAQIGGRLIDVAARQMADTFFERFAALVVPAEPGTGAPAEGRSAPTGAAPRGLRPLVWVPSLIILVLAVILGFGRP